MPTQRCLLTPTKQDKTSNARMAFDPDAAVAQCTRRCLLSPTVALCDHERAVLI